MINATPFKFMLETDRPHVNGEAREKILSLFKEIDTVYKTHMRRSTGKTCDICGKGDNDEVFKVKDLAPGYENRESQSPCLCYNHWHGWVLSYAHLENNRKAKLLNIGRKASNPSERIQQMIQISQTVFDEPILSDEEIDLHFAHYLAKQLTKGLKNETNK